MDDEERRAIIERSNELLRRIEELQVECAERESTRNPLEDNDPLTRWRRLRQQAEEQPMQKKARPADIVYKVHVNA